MPEDNPNDNIQQLRDQASQSKANADKNVLLEKEMAFMRAGVDTQSKPAQALIASYAGDLTPEAILAEATEWGLVKAPQTPATETPPAGGEQQQQTDAEAAAATAAAQAQQDMRQTVAGGGAAPPPEPPVVGGVDRAMTDFKDSRLAGMPKDQAMGLAANNVLAAGVTGDKQALFDPEKWEAEKAKAGHGAQHAR